MNPAPWIGLAGPTASGKSAIAMALAERLPVEIVSVDSALVYRGMDIGTAKPSAAERARVPHHLIDIIDPSQAYSAARFAADATRLIDEINRARPAAAAGRRHDAVLQGACSTASTRCPPPTRPLRAALQAEASRAAGRHCMRELARVDPATAARLPPTDAQRIQRALEVFRVSGRTLSSFHTAPRAAQPAALIALEPRSRAWLHERIAQRFAGMLERGLLDEVRALRSRRDLHADLPSMRCVGYRQAWAALDEGLSGDALTAAVRERGIAATRQLAKRQLTWLRGMQRTVVACDDSDAGSQVAAAVARWRPQ